jgi:hypothetical protein
METTYSTEASVNNYQTGSRKFQKTAVFTITRGNPPRQKVEDVALLQGLRLSAIEQTSTNTDMSFFRLF